MRFHIKYEELSDIRDTMITQLDSWHEELGTLKTSILNVATMPEISGAMADRVRSYMSEVHLPLINMMQDTIETLKSNLILYTAWYYQIDTDMHADISQDCVENQYAHLISGKDSYIETADRIKAIVDELNIYMDAGKFSSAPMTTLYDNAANNLLTLRDSIGEYEETHATYDLTITTDMISCIRGIIGGQLGTSNVRISTYEAGSIQKNNYFQKAQTLNKIQSGYISQVRDQVDRYQAAYIGQQDGDGHYQGIVKYFIQLVNGLEGVFQNGQLKINKVKEMRPLSVGNYVTSGLASVFGLSGHMGGIGNPYLGLRGNIGGAIVNPINRTGFVSNPDWYYILAKFCSITTSIGHIGALDLKERFSDLTSLGNNAFNGILNLVQDIFSKATDLFYMVDENNKKREEHKKHNDTLSLSQFPDATTEGMYIKNQNRLGDKEGYHYADTNASEMGCGAIAVYNALQAVGANIPFSDVLYGTDIATVEGGANLLVMGEYMEDQGYPTTYLYGDEIDKRGGEFKAIIVTCTDINFNGHFYTMVPTGKQNAKGENLYHFYNGYGDYANAVGTYEEGVIRVGEEAGYTIHMAIAI